MTADWQTFFKDKRATQLGLGLLGRGVHDAQFLAAHVAHLTVTDMKTAEQLQESVEVLAGSAHDTLTLVLGEHRMEDFEHVDFVLKGAGVPLASPYIAHARAQGIPVYMDESLFAELAPQGVTLIGITGTRGKTTTTLLIEHVLRTAVEAGVCSGSVHLAGNIRGIATLPLLEMVTGGDTVVAELSSWQLQGFGESKRSPQIAVFTNFFPDHLNYYGGSMEAYFADKAQIFAHQTEGDVLIMSPQAHAALQTYWKGELRGRVIVVGPETCAALTEKLLVPGAHNVQNAALAIAVAKELGITDEIIAHALSTFRGAPGRLERVPCAAPYQVYNDATSTTPDALRVALETLSPLATARGGRLVLICGGTSKELALDSLGPIFTQYLPTVITIPGTGTAALMPLLLVSGVSSTETANLSDAVVAAKTILTENDILVFSPGFASFGEFKNEFDRNDTFLRLVEEWLCA
ncbi:MAG: hypothetical protein RL150_653 [Candidatus Parcubacteria bacterium]|jgi:UDP-N-acetylmuramoylalanine--D-glutamate ligase